MPEHPAVAARPPGYPVRWEADVLLADGTPVRVRPIRPADGPALRAFHRSLSARTVYFRFFSAKPDLTDADVARFTTVDHVHRVALVAFAHGSLAAVGRFDALGDGSAEVAFVVHDDLQGQGLGSILLEHLAAAARERGIERFVAEVLPANTRMLATFREAGYAVNQRHGDDVIDVSFPVAATAASDAVREAREHRAERRSVARLLRPRGLAVVGEPGPLCEVAEAAARNAVAAGFTGAVSVVGVRAPAGAGSAASVTDLPAGTDLVVVAVDPVRLPATIADVGAVGAHGVVVLSASAQPDDPSWVTRQAALVAGARDRGLRIVGPNSLGLVNTAPDVRLNASLLPTLPPAGGIGLFCQSAAIGRALMDRLAARGLGVSTFVSAGNRVDVSGNDLLQYWLDDESTSIVLLYLESIGNARKFARLVTALAQRKPVVTVRTGGAAQRHPLGHAVVPTGLPAAAVDQVLADCGLVVVDRVADLVDVASIAVRAPLPGVGPAVVVANSDALATMAGNALAAAGLGGARPPVLVPREADRATMSAAVVRAAAGAGLVLVAHVPAAEATGDETAGPWPADVPIVAVLPGVDPRVAPATVPVFWDVEDAVVALAHLARLSRWRRRPRGPAGPAIPTSGRIPPGRYADADLVAAWAVAGIAPGLRWAPGSPRRWRLRLVTDPLYGPVVSIGVDDPVAEVLGDRAWRLAPVSPAAAREMVLALGARVTVLPDPVDEVALGHLADALSAASHWLASTTLDLAVADVDAGVIVVRGAYAEAAATVAPAEPDARRLRQVPVSVVDDAGPTGASGSSGTMPA